MTSILSIVLCLCIISCMQAQIETGESRDIDSDHCAVDDRIANVCLKCSSLPFYSLPLMTSCCSEKSAFLFCEACVNDQESCETLMNEIEEVDTFSEEESDDLDYDGDSDVIDNELVTSGAPIPVKAGIEKRFGKLFVNRNPKRFGRLFFGKRSDDADGTAGEMAKRFGRLYMGSGSYFGKRSSMDKRYGRLFTTSNNYFGKRVPDLPDSEGMEPFLAQDEPEDFQISKRYGRIYMGNRNKLFGKRYGRVFFGKRSNDDMDKRYGQLYMGGLFQRNPAYLNMDKRFGRLFTGRRKYYFGK